MKTKTLNTHPFIRDALLRKQLWHIGEKRTEYSQAKKSGDWNKALDLNDQLYGMMYSVNKRYIEKRWLYLINDATEYMDRLIEEAISLQNSRQGA